METNFFDGRYQANVNNTGARARIGYPGSALVNICNPVAGGNPVSTSTSWSMMHEAACVSRGYFQVGYLRGNWLTDQDQQLDPQKEYYFQQYFSCTGASPETRILTASPGIWGTSRCYTVTFSGLQQRWVALVQKTCGGKGIISWSWPASFIDMNPDEVQYFGEVFDFLQAPGANGHNSDSMCGFSYNKCTWQQTQRRDLAGVWRNASTTGAFTPGGHCGYGQTENNPTSFAIWTNFTGC